MLNSSHPVKEGSCLYCILTNKHTIGQFVILPLPVYCYVFKVLSLSKKNRFFVHLVLSFSQTCTVLFEYETS